MNRANARGFRGGRGGGGRRGYRGYSWAPYAAAGAQQAEAARIAAVSLYPLHIVTYADVSIGTRIQSGGGTGLCLGCCSCSRGSVGLGGWTAGWCRGVDPGDG